MLDTHTPIPTRHSHAREARTRRLSRAECAILASIAIALAVVAASPTSRISSADLPTTNVTVRTGDTLWGIASEHPVPGLDTARAADLIAEINGLDGAGLVAGTDLLVPDHSVDTAVAMR